MSFTIGKLSKKTDCKVQTIRYYEDIGLMPEPERNAGNQRLYDEEHVKRLNFIRHSRSLGFSLADIRALLGVHDNPAMSCDKVHEIALTHLTEVNKKIEQLQALKSELDHMVSQCHANEADSKAVTCNVIEVLSDHGQCLHDHHE